ncbi:MAG: GIY-YIG nuclease family protein [Flavobacteriales bacterium]|nr:GIY-YIG nuclease family protein [Flavobacteriales bacterium]
MYAIIDIETTGGSATRSRITEIAIYKHDGEKIVDEYQTLINPCQEIPYNIINLTGIDNDMVADAPLFFDVAAIIDKFTKDCVFVAHNVNFDYGFVKAEFDRIGLSFKRKKLCTVRLSRKLLPGKPSYSLGKLCQSENIIVQNRHRAAGDAKATTVLFGRLLKIDTDGFIENALKPLSYEALMPPNMPKIDFLALPNTQGIYYLLNQKKEIIYIGKAKDIKKRVHSHFSGNTNTKSKYYFVKNIFGIDFQEIPDTILVDIIEATEIKKHWPIHNRSMKRITLNHGLFQYTDRNGYERFNSGRCGKHDKPIKSFKSLVDLKHFLKEIVIDYNLCPRLSNLQPISSGKCHYVEDLDCRGACMQEESAALYNLRVQQAIEEKVNQNTTYILKEQSKDGMDQAVILVEKGRYKGYGKLPIDSDLTNLDFIKSKIHSAYDDQDMSILVNSYFKKAKEEDVIFIN